MGSDSLTSRRTLTYVSSNRPNTFIITRTGFDNTPMEPRFRA
ncbi:hypothetical protein FHU13_004984 [Methylobacterium sp. R2-1]|nr:hypothetical protein [Methylobacterium sp. R2-1]